MTPKQRMQVQNEWRSGKVRVRMLVGTARLLG